MVVVGQSLLTLPSEIRTAIWLHVFNLRCLHVLPGGNVWCNPPKEDFTSLQHIDIYHHYFSQPHLEYSSSANYQSASLAAVCWQLFHEVAQLRYQRTLISFSSSALALSYLSTKLSTSTVTGFSLSRLCNVQLHLGPAKHNTHDANTNNQSILNSLANEAKNLDNLSLVFTFFYGAQQETLPLSKKTLICLWKFANLSSLNLYMGDALPGPIGRSETYDRDYDQFWRRWQYTEALLRRRVCRATAWTRDCLSKFSCSTMTMMQPFLCAKKLDMEVLRALVRELEADHASAT